jgi:hypothetical protein
MHSMYIKSACAHASWLEMLLLIKSFYRKNKYIMFNNDFFSLYKLLIN